MNGCMNELDSNKGGPHSSSLDTLELAGVQGVFSQATPLLQQTLSPRCQSRSHFAHLHSITQALGYLVSQLSPLA